MRYPKADAGELMQTAWWCQNCLQPVIREVAAMPPGDPCPRCGHACWMVAMGPAEVQDVRISGTAGRNLSRDQDAKAGDVGLRASVKRSPMPPQRAKICACGHSKTMHEAHAAGVAPGVPSGCTCLLCDCAEYRYGSRKVLR